MQRMLIFSFLEKVFYLLVKGSIIFRDSLFTILISLFGIILFILEFPLIKLVLVKILYPASLYLVGSFLTDLPNYLILCLSFLPIKFVAPIYILSFIYMFLI